MNERVKRLREQSLDAKPTISAERALIMTDFYREAPAAATPVIRALAFQRLMERKTIWIGDGELIVGERGPEPKATPTFPELCCHSLSDLDILNSREKIPFAVSDEVRQAYQDVVIPFWQGRALRDVIFAEVTPEWRDAYDAGLFTEFMEQRAPGHTVLDGKIYVRGFNDFKRDIEAALAALDFINDPEAFDKSQELKGMAICCDAIVAFAKRHADLAREKAAGESDPQRQAELLKVAETCEWVPANAPRNFQEALQAYWFCHLGVTTELNTWDSYCPGRLDQHLIPFYRKGLEDGTLDREGARELLQCFWVKFNNQPAPPKVGVTAAESGTYTDFCNINSGGLTPDGEDGVNEVTELVLEVIDEMRLLQPSSNIQLSKKNPDRFLKQALRIVRKGWGQPSIFNADSVVSELLRQGKTIEDARQGGTSGCVETGAFGKEAYILTGYMNLPKLLELALHDGVDPRTGKRLGPASGREFATFDDLFHAFEKQLEYTVGVKMRGSAVIERLYATRMPSPFLSVLVSDCIKNGKDYNAGGARYNTSYIQGVGIGTITDCLSAIRTAVFEKKQVALGVLVDVLDRDFADAEPLRQSLMNRAPRYGNDDDEADGLMRRVFDAYYAAINGKPNTRGGTYRINMLPTTCHIYFGEVTGATPDGRHAGQPLSEGISPVQGADRNGPTAVLQSAAKMDHLRTGGTLLNMKFTPQLLEGEEGIDSLAKLVRTYFRMDGHHIQFNVVRAETLRKAQQHPEHYRDLIVRVAGYSDYFCDLSRALQDEIIARTEHKSM